MSSLHTNVVASLGSEECLNSPGLLQHNKDLLKII
jgi:hypothetical protein